FSFKGALLPYFGAFTKKEALRRGRNSGKVLMRAHSSDPIVCTYSKEDSAMETASAAPVVTEAFFSQSLEQADKDIFDAIRSELGRQRHEIELIASENIVSRAVMEAQGTVLTN